jgi:hypothetical protein
MGEASETAPAGSADGGARGAGEAAPAASVIGELLAAAQAAAVALAEDQKLRGSERTADFADAVRRIARCFDQSQVPQVAEWADQAAGEIDKLSQLMRARRWDELAADAAAAARRQPAVFLLAAVTAGFVAGRLLTGPPEHPPAETSAPRVGADIPAREAAAGASPIATAADERPA